MNEQGMRRALVAWLKSVFTTPPPIVYNWQASPETGPFIAFRIGSILSKAYDTQLGLNADYKMVIGGLRQATIGISYFGYSPEGGTALNYAMQNAQMISNSLETNPVQAAFKAAGYAYLYKNPVVNTTYLLESKYQPRADFDFYLGFVDKSGEIGNQPPADESYIETARIRGRFEGADEIIDVDAIVDPIG